jgi:hypothetical protein
VVVVTVTMTVTVTVTVVAAAVAKIYHRCVRKAPTDFQGRHVCGDILLWMRE